MTTTTSGLLQTANIEQKDDTGDVLINLARSIAAWSGPPAWADNAMFTEMMDAPFKGLATGGSRCKQLAGLYLICGTALEQCFLQPRPVPDVDAHLSSKIIDYVQKNYTHTLTLEQMARDLGYNYTYLSAYFNHSLHTGFQGFINQYRISHAAALLQGSSLPITQVAEQCGFGTIRSFNRVFLKEKGMTPSAFRKQNVL